MPCLHFSVVVVFVKAWVGIVWQLQSNIIDVLLKCFCEDRLAHFVWLHILRANLFDLLLSQEVVCLHDGHIHRILYLLRDILRRIVQVDVSVINGYFWIAHAFKL